MSDKAFFKPTNLYKEYMILDLIEKNKDITQRELANYLEVAVSMVNLLIDNLEKDGFVKRKKHNSKNVMYNLTKSGLEKKKVLNLGYLKNTQELYNKAKLDITSFLEKLEFNGYKKILLYGSGEVAEILLNTINSIKASKIDIIGVIDDYVTKIGSKFSNIKIVSLDNLKNINFDGILISSYTNHNKMLRKLKGMIIDDEKIITFF